MKRITVTLPEDLDVRLRLEATHRGMTITELTREAVRAFLDHGRRRTLLAAGAGRSGRADLSERIEDLLRQELAR